jgi:hypothetical protein
MPLARCGNSHGFKPGRAYRFERRPSRGFAPKFEADRSRRLAFVRQAYGDRVLLYVFRSAAGGWLETFTSEQIKDYIVEEAKQ